METPERDRLERDIKVLIIDSLMLEDTEADEIDSQEALFGAGLGLDSIDALELALVLENQYGVKIEDDPETLLVDEAAEIREMRRDELGIGTNAREQSSDEFVCTECFLVKKVSQLANKSRRVCRDCV